MEHLPNPPQVRIDSCGEHGDFEAKNLFGRIWSRCPACSEKSAIETRKQQEEEERRERERRARKLLGRAAIPTRFIGRNFDNFEADTDAKRQALTTMRDYSESFEEYASKGKGLILSGKPGTGKSHLASAVLQAHIERDVLYATCLDLIRMVRETWRKDSEQSERQVLAYLGELDLLVIDEMGVQYGTEGEQTILFDVLDARYRDMQPTILLTNQGVDGLRGYLGDRTFDRLRETCRIVAFEWESYRPKARSAA